MRSTTGKIIIGSVLVVLISTAFSIHFLSARPKQTHLRERLRAFPADNLPLRAPAAVHWDEHLIPFIEAQNDTDCAFLLGMVHSHLRLGQMTLLRRATQGRLAELAGPLAVDIDRGLRTLNLGLAADSIEAALPPSTRAWLDAFVTGINHYQSACDKLPPEFDFLGIEPEPWRLRDLLVIGRLMGADVTWFNGLQWIKYQDKPYFRELYGRFAALGMHSSASFTPLTQILSNSIKSGSNALVIAANKSSTGSALIASDPHLGLQLPNLWIIAGYKCPSYHVLGLMFPGVPMVLIGRNESIAWAGTNMRSQSSDIYELDAAEQSSITVREEKIRVRWWRDKHVPVRTSAWGPVISDISALGAREGQTLALKWLGHQPSDEFSAFLRINRAESWPEFRDAFASYGVSGQNFLYADRTGDIGMVLAVRVPGRKQNYSPAIIHSGSDATAQWQGFIPSTALPVSYNPDEGFIASANNLPAQTQPPVGYFFSGNDRIDRLKNVLTAKKNWTIADLQQLHRDVHSISARELSLKMASCAQTWQVDALQDTAIQKIVARLSGWDGDYQTDSVAPVAFQSILHQFIMNYYSERYDEEAAGLILGAEQANALVLEDLSRMDDARVRRCLDQALMEALPAVQKYKNWGEMHRLRLAHPFGNIPLIGGKYRFGDFPAGGSYLTLMKTAHRISDEQHYSFYGANARFIADLAQPDENYFVLLGGQDGWLGSDLLTDQVPIWLSGKYLKIPFELEQVRWSFADHFSFPGTGSR